MHTQIYITLLIFLCIIVPDLIVVIRSNFTIVEAEIKYQSTNYKKDKNVRPRLCEEILDAYEQIESLFQNTDQQLEQMLHNYYEQVFSYYYSTIDGETYNEIPFNTTLQENHKFKTQKDLQFQKQIYIENNQENLRQKFLQEKENQEKLQNIYQTILNRKISKLSNNYFIPNPETGQIHLINIENYQIFHNVNDSDYSYISIFTLEDNKIFNDAFFETKSPLNWKLCHVEQIEGIVTNIDTSPTFLGFVINYQNLKGQNFIKYYPNLHCQSTEKIDAYILNSNFSQIKSLNLIQQQLLLKNISQYIQTESKLSSLIHNNITQYMHKNQNLNKDQISHSQQKQQYNQQQYQSDQDKILKYNIFQSYKDYNIYDSPYLPINKIAFYNQDLIVYTNIVHNQIRVLQNIGGKTQYYSLNVEQYQNQGNYFKIVDIKIFKYPYENDFQVILIYIQGSHTQQFLSCDLYQIKAESQDQNSNHMKTYHHTTNLQVKNNLGYYKDGEYYFNDKNEENNYKQSDEFKQYEKEKHNKQNKDENNLTLVQTLYKKNITNQINTAFGPHINKWQNEVLNQIHVAFNKLTQKLAICIFKDNIAYIKLNQNEIRIQEVVPQNYQKLEKEDLEIQDIQFSKYGRYLTLLAKNIKTKKIQFFVINMSKINIESNQKYTNKQKSQQKSNDNNEINNPKVVHDFSSQSIELFQIREISNSIIEYNLKDYYTFEPIQNSKSLKLILLGYSGEIITLNIFMENKNSIKKSVFHEIMDIGSTLFILLAFIITFLSAKTIFGNLDDVENFNAAQIITGDNEDEDDEDDEEQESDQEQILFEV